MKQNLHSFFFWSAHRRMLPQLPRQYIQIHTLLHDALNTCHILLFLALPLRALGTQKVSPCLAIGWFSPADEDVFFFTYIYPRFVEHLHHASESELWVGSTQFKLIVCTIITFFRIERSSILCCAVQLSSTRHTYGNNVLTSIRPERTRSDSPRRGGLRNVHHSSEWQGEAPHQHRRQ